MKLFHWEDKVRYLTAKEMDDAVLWAIADIHDGWTKEMVWKYVQTLLRVCLPPTADHPYGEWVKLGKTNRPRLLKGAKMMLEIE